MTTSTDRIEKRVLLRASRERVWEAITDSKKFGTWFGVEFESAFAAGQRVHGRVVPTKVDAAVAKEQEPYAGMEFDVIVDEIAPMDRFSFRWHPGEPPVDETEPMTLVTFELREAKDGVMLTITESGFDRIPLERRAKAFAANEAGWAAQATLIEKYLAHAA
jgi:uncharacterized protein YndB with AHSA1/START domain